MEVGNIRPGAELYAVTANTARNLGRLFIGRASDVYFRWVQISVDGGRGGRDGGGGLYIVLTFNSKKNYTPPQR